MKTKGVPFTECTCCGESNVSNHIVALGYKWPICGDDLCEMQVRRVAKKLGYIVKGENQA